MRAAVGLRCNVVVATRCVEMSVARALLCMAVCNEKCMIIECMVMTTVDVHSSPPYSHPHTPLVHRLASGSATGAPLDAKSATALPADPSQASAARQGLAMLATARSSPRRALTSHSVTRRRFAQSHSTQPSATLSSAPSTLVLSAGLPMITSTTAHGGARGRLP